MSPQQIHLIFKTHLDIGFTDHAARVRRQYHEQFIPQALATGAHFFAEDPEHPAFIWTTGAWLIWDHLETQDVERVRALEQAITRGLITWHALPFTTHTELMSPSLFRAGLSYAEALDRRFGRKTIAAKMTDVPGHTLGMVPLLAEAGVRFIHIGVNTASPVPDVPPIFRWQAPQGEELVVMYQASYGATDFPAGPDVGLSFAHTNDNIGPQSVAQTVEALRALAHAHPAARIYASTLDAFGAQMWGRRQDFPVITSEIGDSWIHGAASDPEKLAHLRALDRLTDSWGHEVSASRLAFGRRLALVAEHTWGVDIKTYLRDEIAWDRVDFEAARHSDYRFAFCEASWAEQRAYIDQALEVLELDDRQDADAALGACAPPPAPVQLHSGDVLQDGGWTVELDAQTGDFLAITSPGGRRLSAEAGSLFGYRHESYDWSALQRHLGTYLQHRENWAILDHDKPGLDRSRTARNGQFAPCLAGIETGNNVALAEMPRDGHDSLGAPETCETRIRGLDATHLEITVTLRDKPANRMPEAGFVHIQPAFASNWMFKKMGLWVKADDVVARGGGQLQAIGAACAALSDGTFEITLLDAALVGPAGVDFLPFNPDPPDFSHGLRVNLYNNKWGTNFPMWWEGTLAFRFVIGLS